MLTISCFYLAYNAITIIPPDLNTIDADDKKVLSYNMFTHAKLKDIVEYKEQKRPQPSKDFKRFLNKFNTVHLLPKKDGALKKEILYYCGC